MIFMNSKFYSDEAKYLYNLIVSFNQSVMEDLTQESIHKFSLINEGSLLNYCNTIFTTKPFSDEKYCETIEDYLTYTIYYLNKGHCFLDGNKRTTLLTTMFFIEEFGLYNFDTEFFRGVLAVFLVDMLEEKMTKEDVKKWIEKQLKSKI